MQDFINSFLATYAALFPICNPLGNAAIFLSITDGEKIPQRQSQALKGSLYMVGILLLFWLLGNTIMSFFGISLTGIRIAGGLVVAHVGFKLLNPAKEQKSRQPEEDDEAQSKPDISLSPLGTPLLAGPGSIAVVMSMSTLQKGAWDLGMYGIGAGVIAVGLTCWIMLREAPAVLGVLGVNGANAVTKIMAFLLLCIGVQLGLDGGGEWLRAAFAKPA